MRELRIIDPYSKMVYESWMISDHESVFLYPRIMDSGEIVTPSSGWAGIAPPWAIQIRYMGEDWQTVAEHP